METAGKTGKTAKQDTLEIMEFVVGSNVYGINVAKVKEVVQYSTPLPSPDQHPCVEGILMLRGTPIPIIDMAKRIGAEVPGTVGSDDMNTDGENDRMDRNIFIIAGFNNLRVGLHVHAVNGIRKLAWSDIKSPSETISRYNNCIITGIVNLKEKILVLLDFEKIVADINPTTTICVDKVNVKVGEDISSKPIMVVDDSQMLNKLICKSLSKAGYNNIISLNNGLEAWEVLEKVDDKTKIKDTVSAIVCDIEMPVMDGLTLCEKIKSDNDLRLIPVIMFSSLIDESMAMRCEQVGANAQFSKTQIDRLVSVLETYLK